MVKTGLSRRDFLRISSFAACGCLLAGCSAATNPDGQSSNYYIKNRDMILKEVGEIMAYVQKVGGETYGEAKAKTLVAAALQGFSDLLPGLPDIGGGDNDLTANLYQSAAALALYRTMLANDYTAQDAGRILYLAFQRQMTSLPMMGINGRLASSSMAQDKLKGEAELSHKRTYPADWVFDFVPGEGTTFDYGIDYTECGICKYFKAQGASEFVPYLCLLDFPISEAMNTGLVRTTTLAHGGSRCDFRYQFGRPCRPEWVPDFLAK
jgi:hypothetical protein